MLMGDFRGSRNSDAETPPLQCGSSANDDMPKSTNRNRKALFRLGKNSPIGNNNIFAHFTFSREYRGAVNVRGRWPLSGGFRDAGIQ